ncbi:MAG: dihydrolipoamide acetyltransferase [Myxococcota bacterium]
MMGRIRTAFVLAALWAGSSPAFAQDDGGSPWGGADAPPAEDAGDATAKDGTEAPAPAPEPTGVSVGTSASEGDTTVLTEDQLAERRKQGDRTKELLTVEQDVSNLKERVFRSKATLQLLRELVIEGATLGSRVSIWHVNKMSNAYTVESVQYFLDGKAIFSRTDTTGGLDSLDAVEIHAQTLPPGSHTLQVNMVLRGNGMGVFSYLRAYSFKLQSSYAFTVEDGQLTTVQVMINEKGGPFTNFVDRPDVRYEENMESLRSE